MLAARAKNLADGRSLFRDVGLVDDDVVEVPSSSPGPADRGGATVQITVQMVVDPDRCATAPESAIRGYERKRVFHLFQVRHLTGTSSQEADDRTTHCQSYYSLLPTGCRSRHTS